MSFLNIQTSDIPSLKNKNAVVTGGASGIGLATVKLLAAQGARVCIVDVNAPEIKIPEDVYFIKCDTTSWTEVCSAFKEAGTVDIVVANAGISEKNDFLTDEFDEAGILLQPNFGVVEVNFLGVLNIVKLAISYMKRQGTGGSIVIVSSATAFAPEQSLPVYSASKLALIGLIRALRSTLPAFNIHINAVAPAATATKTLPPELAAPLVAAGLPVSSPEMVALAVVFSATAKQSKRVEPYGKDQRWQ